MCGNHPDAAVSAVKRFSADDYGPVLNHVPYYRPVHGQAASHEERISRIPVHASFFVEKTFNVTKEHLVDIH